MKRNSSRLALTLFALLMVMLVSCVKQETPPPSNEAKAAPPPAMEEKKSGPAQLPVRFQNSSYITEEPSGSDVLGEDTDDYQVKVGANISSTQGPQPLWDILKRLASLKGMNVSWASDVQQSDLVDVDINADDNFFDAIDDLLRQVDYFHEVKGNTIVVKYKETKTFRLPVPFMKGNYITSVGGNFLADRNAATGTEGTVKIISEDNPVDVWENVKLNLETILEIWTGRREGELVEGIGDVEAQQAARTYTGTAEQTGGGAADLTEQVEGAGQGAQAVGVTKRVAQGYYTLDKHIGLITVTAPRPMMQKVDAYFENLVTESMRQVVIEAKIIEVFLKDNSKIGIDWTEVLKNFDLTGWVEFGTGGLLGQIWPWNPPRNDPKVSAKYPDQYPDSMVYRVTADAVPWNLMLNALNEQGEATVLSNPKITVLNGQPAVLSVGTDVTYIDSIETEIDSENGNRNYTINTDSIVEGVSLGVMCSILDNTSVVLHLTPITTDIVGDTIEYKQIGFGEIGLPVVQVRQLSTMVEVQNGEMLIIGGLIDSANRQEDSFAPVVGKIPLVRYLFGVEEKIMEKRELVVLLTPRII